MSFHKFYKLAKNKLFTINRSITGKGIRKTLYLIKKEFPALKIYNISSKTKVFDWEVPDEWNVVDAYVLDKDNKKIINFKKNNLHLVGYSTKINSIINKKKLFEHLHSLPKQLDAIPYVTSYYNRTWGFCISHRTKLKFDKKYNSKDIFKVVIKSSHNLNGNLNYGELVLKGSSKQEILISTYLCHPSMANNELSGPIVSMSLIEYFTKIKKLDKTIRFLFIPETIGSIVYLSENLLDLKNNVIGGYNLSCIGDERMHSCMLSKYENSPSDKSLIEAYKKLKIKYKRFSFLKRGSDERQFNSPGIDIPITSIFRTKYAEYPEYHTSLDDFKLVTLKGISGGFKVASNAIKILLKKIIPKNIVLCEPQMGKRGLYPAFGYKGTENYMNFLQYADGKNDLNMISKKIKVNLLLTKKIYIELKKYKLIY
jgi:aminopeptidase-like protein